MSPILAALDGRHAQEVVLRDATGVLHVADLQARIAQVAETLAVLPPGPVASMLDNGIDWVVLDLALLRCGRAHIALPPFFTAQQRVQALAAAAVVALPRARDAIDASSAVGFSLAAREGERQAAHAGTALVTYTSGSTGVPRGVCLDATLPATVAGALQQAMRPLDVRRHLCLLPLGVLLEAIGGVYAPLLAGGEIALPSLAALGHGGSGHLDVQRLLVTVHRYRPQSVIAVPQMLQALVHAVESGARLPDSLRMIAVGGARVPPSLLARAAALHLPVFEGYGLSECASVVCLNRPGAVRAGSVGQALPHTGIAVTPDGEVQVTGPRFLGYLGEAATAPGPLHTGDLGALDAEGFLHLHGRRKALYITAWGRNVSPEWIESELTQHPLIAQALAWGEGRTQAAAVLVPRSSHCTTAELERAVAAVNAGLPDYARIGAVLRASEPFSVDNGLLTGNGRIRRESALSRYGAALAACPDVTSESASESTTA
jgi:long-chain acyl-CoA synthetase